jgi:protein-export membrane protein SecD
MSKENQDSMKSKKTEMFISIFRAVVVLIVTGLIGFFVYTNAVGTDAKFPFKLGLDLAGGSQLTYVADVSEVSESEVSDLMEVLRIVIERRINIFGVSEPNVQVEKSSIVSGNPEQRLIVELPGVTDIDSAIDAIGKTPLLEFKLVDTEALAREQALADIEASITGSSSVKVSSTDDAALTDPYIETGLTGRYLDSAALEFSGSNSGTLSNEPIVSIVFNSEGADLFAKITSEHTGENLAIFLDGDLISAPRINETINGGKAIISGGFTPEEARSLAQNLNFGALPVPIELASTQTIGGTLGETALASGVYAGVIGFILLSIFMILWYRLPGIIAVVALSIYVVLMLALFQLIPVVLTAAGLAGLILSVGLAVDANVLIAERIKEELKSGKAVHEAINEGFARAWLAIRDSNITHIIATIVLFWFGTSLIKGFALVFGLGVVVSMFSAITVSRTLLMALPINTDSKIGKFLMSSGFSK